MSGSHGVFDSAPGAVSDVVTVAGADGSGIRRVVSVNTAGRLQVDVISGGGGGVGGGGDASAANQVTGNTSLAAIATANGAPADAAWSGSGSGGLVALLKAVWTRLGGTLSVSGTFWQATQPVSLSSLPALATGANAIGSVSVSNLPATGTSVATGQATPATTATLIVASRTGRVDVTVTNLGTTDVWIGGAGVTTSTGTLLPGARGERYTISGGAAVYGIVASGTQAVSYLEAY